MYDTLNPRLALEMLEECGEGVLPLFEREPGGTLRFETPEGYREFLRSIPIEKWVRGLANFYIIRDVTRPSLPRIAKEMALGIYAGSSESKACVKWIAMVHAALGKRIKDLLREETDSLIRGRPSILEVAQGGIENALRNRLKQLQKHDDQEELDPPTLEETKALLRITPMPGEIADILLHFLVNQGEGREILMRFLMEDPVEAA